MSDPSFGLVVEGVYDQAVFTELVRKLTLPAMEVLPRVCHGISKLMKNFPALLGDLEHMRQGQPVAKALVIGDSGGKDPKALEQGMRKKIAGRNFSFPKGLDFCIVVREMETWLLADEDAIGTVALSRGGREVPRVQSVLEDLMDPKEHLMRLLSRALLP